MEPAHPMGCRRMFVIQLPSHGNSDRCTPRTPKSLLRLLKNISLTSRWLAVLYSTQATSSMVLDGGVISGPAAAWLITKAMTTLAKMAANKAIDYALLERIGRYRAGTAFACPRAVDGASHIKTAYHAGSLGPSAPVHRRESVREPAGQAQAPRPQVAQGPGAAAQRQSRGGARGA